MEGDHADVILEKSENVDSIFTLFSNLTGEKNQNPKFCLELIRSLRGNKFTVGSGNNVVYSVKRIVRGLGSTRLYSQCGCFASLASALKYNACSVENVLEILEKEQCPVKGATKSEVRALSIECVLACGAIINSGLYNDQPVEIQETILQKLIEAGMKKNYLCSVTCRFLVDVVQMSDAEKFKDTVWPILKSFLKDNLDDCSEDGLYLLLVCLKKNYKLINKFLKKNLTSFDSFEKMIVTFLLNNTVKYDHPIYESAALLLCTNIEMHMSIWHNCVNENAKKNFKKNGILITIFFHILKNLTEATAIPELLVPKFIEVFLKVLSFRKAKNYKDEDCYATAKSALNLMTLLLCAEAISDTIRLETIKKLLFYPANMKFEMITGTKCIHLLTSNLNADFVKTLVDVYRQVLDGELKKIVDESGREEDWTCKEKQIVLHMFTRMLNHPRLRKEMNWKLEEIKFLFSVGFLRKKTQLSSEIQKCAKECFYKSIMLQMPSLKELVLFLDDLTLHINENIKNKNFELADEVVDLWDKMFSVVSNLKKKSTNKLFIAVHVLLIYMGFHLFEDYELAKGGIEDLLSCYDRLKEIHKKKGNKDDDEDSPHWTEVTVDLILSLLSRENKLWRHVVSCIFSQMTTHLTSSALHQIIDALDPKSQHNVLNHVDSDRSESEGESGEESESDESDSDVGDPEDEDGEEKVNDQLRLAVRNALGYTAAALTDEESIDMDQMDEEEEKKLNERLGQAFKLFKSRSRGRKKKQTKEEEAVTHFRIRVLDLVEIYVSSNPSMGGCLDLILPLLDVLEATIKDPFQRPLQNKVDSVLKSVSAVKSFSDTDKVDQTVVKTVLEAVIGKKEIPALIFVEMSPRISDCTTFLVRCSQQLPANGAEVPLVAEYDALLRAFFSSRDFKLPISVFQTVLRITWKGNFKLTETLFEFLAAPNVRTFKKMKVIELLRIFYKNEKLQESADDKTKSELSAVETNFINNFVGNMADYERIGLKPTEKMYLSFFSNIITLINLIRGSFKMQRQHLKKSPPWKKLILKLSEISILNENKKTRSQLANLAAAFQVTLPPAKTARRKRNEEPEPAEEDPEARDPPKKRKKVGKGRDKLKLKKESRKIREEMSSRGLEGIRFSALGAPSWAAAEAEDEAEAEAESSED